MKINYSIIKKKSNLAKKKNNNLSTQFWSFSTLVFILMIILSNFSKADWEQINSIPYPFSSLYYLDVYLLPTNPNFVWVCGRSGAVLRSTDAGKTWKTAQIKDRFVVDLQLEKIHFVSDKVGFTSGSNKMFKSTDGGVTWIDISDPRATAIWGHWFYDELNGIMLGDGCIDNQQFFRTTDGGVSWNLKEYSIYESGLTHVQMMSLNGKAYAVSSGFLWESNDGGYNWATKSSTGAKDWQEQLAVNGNSFLFPVSSGCSGGGFGGARMSVDGGNTWKAIPTNSACFGSYLLTPSNGWFAGTNRTVYHTTDAGKTWNNEYCGIPAGTDLDDIKFYNDTLGFVVGKGVFKYKNYNKEKPEIVGSFPVYLCAPESITLKTSKKYKNYLWSNGETSETIKINKSGKYFVKVWNTDCDAGSSELVDVTVNQAPLFNIISDKGNLFCEGDTAVLSLNSTFSIYKWNTGENSKSIKINKSGIYKCEVVDTNGCKGSAEINISINPKPQITINKILRSTFCIGDSIFLNANIIEGNLEWFKDNVNNSFSKNNLIWIKESGQYFAKVVSSNGCIAFSDTLPITFKKDTNKMVIEFLSSDNSIDFGKSNNESILRDLKISNIGFDDFTLNDILLFKNLSFSVPASQLPVTIPSKGYVILKVNFNPNKIGECKDTLIFEDVCTNHTIPLKGEGLPNEFIANGKCNTTIKLVTTSYGESNVLSIGEPYPNPAIDKIEVPVEYSKEEDLIKIKISVYNYIGNEILSNYIISKNNKNSSNILINFESIRSGVYFIKISSELETHIFPIIINK